MELCDIDNIIQAVIGASYKVYNTLGAGFLEKIYEKALCIELQKTGLKTERQYPVPVFYDNQKIGDYYADLFTEDRLIVELKAVENVCLAHEKQLVNYLSATSIDHGLLINCSVSGVQVKRKFRIYRSTKSHNSHNQHIL